ncbi:unnamed protein product [Mycena citricolor]|uniref:Uncharacterized protein n=1 Tax=Mycena citricolor TaxID=2018698 RepID=A0AAD2K5V6_9AGAR|nr:unnamed protein product [Mycena citricolor]
MVASALLLAVLAPFAVAKSYPAQFFDPLVPQKVLKTAQSLPSPIQYPQYTGITSNTGVWQLFSPNTWTSAFFPATMYALNTRKTLCGATAANGLGAADWLGWGRSLSNGLIPLEQSNGVGHDVGFLSFPFVEELAINPTNQTAIAAVNKFAADLAARFNPVVGCTRSWDTSDPTLFQVIIDNMMNLEVLWVSYKLTGNATLRHIAETHANTTMKNHIRPDGGTWHVIEYNATTGAVVAKITSQGFSNNSTWSRGQAWGVYGFANMYKHTGYPAYLDTARKLANYYLTNLPADGIVPWDFNAPLTPAPRPSDSSAATVVATGLILLASVETPDNVDKWRNLAMTILNNITALAWKPSWQSLLSNGTVNWPAHNLLTGIVYGDYYFIKGAGISGISLAHDVQETGEKLDLTIYEMASDVGGTWLWNRYPGIRCDIPSVNYQMHWCPNPDWSEYYSTGDEIQRYYKSLVDRFELWKYIHLQHEVTHAEWDDGAKKWKLRIRGPDQHEFEDECDVFLNGGGVLNVWKWPSIEGLHSFKGTLCHTARWPENLSLKDKRVAVIGSGSSGIQVLAAIQPEVKQLYHWIRSPTWITGAFAPQFAGPGGVNFKYSEEQKERFRNDPEHALKYRKMIESELNERFKFIVQGTPEQLASLEFGNRDMRERLKQDERLIDAIVPKDFAVGCRRPTPGNGYLEALLEPNVQVYTEMFQRITEKGFIDAQGNEVEVDVIVCATGFDTSFKPRFPIVAHGVNIQDLWKEYPVDSYLSVAVKNFPNYFMYYGPHGPTAHGSGAPVIHAYTTMFLKIIKKLQMENITAIKIKDKAADDFNEHRELYVKRTAWVGNCSSWFRLHKDAAPMLFPGNRVLFMELLYNIRWEDWDYEYGYAGNRFGYLGTGFTQRETDGRDTTFYYGVMDGRDEQPDYADIRPLYAWR